MVCVRCTFVSGRWPFAREGRMPNASRVTREHVLARVRWAMVPALLAACAGAPAYQAPRVRVAPAYDAVGARAADRNTTGSSAVGSAGAARPATGSAQFSPTTSPVPFWRDLGDTTLT